MTYEDAKELAFETGFLSGNETDGYEINTIALDMNYNKTIGDEKLNYNIHGEATVVNVSDSQFNQMDSIVSIDTLQATANVTQPDPRKPFKCNFSFDLNLGIKLSLPDLNSPPPNFDLLYSIGNFTTEISKINDDLIKSIQSLNCCDLENAYNTTIVPFFRWFADHEDIRYCSYDNPDSTSCGPMFGNRTFPMILLDIAKTLVQLYIVVRPLVCLFRPVPGNPWWPFDIDQMYWVRFIITMFDVYYDIIISGKLVDVVLTHPAKKIRESIEVCLFGEEREIPEELNRQITKFNNLLKAKKDIEDDIKIHNAKISKYTSQKNNIENGILTFRFIDKTIKDQEQEIDPGVVSNINTIMEENEDPHNYVFNCTFNELKAYIKQDKNFDPGFLNFAFLDFIYSKTKTNSVYGGESLENRLNNNSSYYLTIEGNSSLSELFVTDKVITDKNDITSLYKDSANTNTKMDPFRPIFESINGKIDSLKKKIATQTNINSNLNKNLNIINGLIVAAKSNLIKSSKNSIASETYLNIASIKKMANNNSICDCLVSSLESLTNTTFKIPLPEDILNISRDGFNNVKDKESYKIKLKDIPSTQRATIRGLILPIADNPNDIVGGFLEKGIVYNDKFINSVLDEADRLQKNITAKTLDSGKINIEIDNKSISLDKKLLSQTSRSTPLLAYLEAADNVFGKDLRVLYTIKEEDFKLSVPDPYDANSTVKEIDIQNIETFSIDWIPTDVYPSSFSIFKLGTRNLNKRYYNKYIEYKNTYTKALAIDKDLRNKFCSEVSKVLNTIDQDLTNSNNNLSIIKSGKLKLRQNLLKNLHESLCLNYPPFDLDHKFSLHYISEYREFLNNATANDDDDDELTSIKNALNNWYESRYKAVSGYTNDDNIEVPSIVKFFYYKDLIRDLNEWISEDHPIINDWVWSKVDIPCSCDGIICKLIQIIINMILSFLTQFVQRVFNYIMDLFWKSPIGKLLKLIISKVQCVMMLVNVKKDLSDLEKLVDGLKESLKNNIKLYTDPGVCLNQALTDENTNPTPPTSTNSSNDTIVTDSSGGTNDPNTLITNTTDPNGTASGSLNTSTSVSITTNDDGTTTIQTTGGDTPTQLQDKFTGAMNNLPATLILTTQVKPGAFINYPNHKFPLLVFDCNCEDECIECNDETKVQTIKELNNIK